MAALACLVYERAMAKGSEKILGRMMVKFKKGTFFEFGSQGS